MTDTVPPGLLRSGLAAAVPVLPICLGLGAFMGFAWNLWAPRAELSVKDGSVVYARVTEATVGADLTFALLGIVCGLLVAIFVWLRWSSGGLELVIVAAIGGLLGSLLAWRVGLVLAGNSANSSEVSAEGRSPGVAFQGPLALASPGVLGLWSLASVLVLLLVFWRRAAAASRRVDAILVQSHYLESLQSRAGDS